MLCWCILAGELCETCVRVSDDMRSALSVRDASLAYVKAVSRMYSKVPQSVQTLHTLMDRFPTLVYVRTSLVDGLPDVVFRRAVLCDVLRHHMPTLVMTSLERGLKHAGFVVRQTTHGSNDEKLWRLTRV